MPLNAISHTMVYVVDQDEALDFYVGKLGLEVQTDAQLEFMRFLTVAVPGRPDAQLLLSVPGPPVHDERTAAQLRELIGKGALTAALLTTSDCRAEFERLSALGVEFTQEPTERFYGIDCALRDPFGNWIRITEPAEVVVVPS
jgi:catechol 2,3-dioxygenase-like lactoylglutathione lyase family enzyme